MNLQIDTEKKTIKLEEDVNLGKLFEVLEMLLPNERWREYKLLYGGITHWADPIIYQPYVGSPNPDKPFWEQPWCTSGTITTSSGTTTIYNNANTVIGCTTSGVNHSITPYTNTTTGLYSITI